MSDKSNRKKQLLTVLFVLSIQSDVAGSYDHTMMCQVLTWQSLIGRCGQMIV
jgi:hypothetical protein